MQAVGRFALFRELIQPRKETGDADGEIVNVIEASTGGAVKGEAQPRPSGSLKTVACMYRSALELGRPLDLLACGVRPANQKEAA